MGVLFILVFVVTFVGLGLALHNARRIMQKSPGTDRMVEISRAIHEGATAFLNKEYRVIAVFVLLVVLVLVLFVPDGWKLSIAFVLGSVFSAAAGNLGMRIATIANTRAAYASKKSVNDGLRIAFSSGSVMGLSVVSLGLLGVALLYLVFYDPTIIFGFGFGASSVALFARVGGGIFTKAADVGADLVGKVEVGIPEDDPRNPAVIADNVGDNVGDVAGMGADLFESYVDSIIAAMVIGAGLAVVYDSAVILPLILAAAGIIASMLGMYFVRARAKTDPERALDKGVIAAAIIMTAFSYVLINWLTGSIGLFYAMFSGLVSGIVVGLSTEYYTSSHRRPARSIAEASRSGAGTNVIQGISVGMISTVVPVLAVSAAIIIAFKFGGMYGISIAAVGMLSTLGITLATNCYAPVADNAAGIAEMAKMPHIVRKRAEMLDAVGNTTAAIGKGFAIGSAAFTALALFVSYTAILAQYGKAVQISATDPYVVVGLFIGALLPFIFCSITMRAVATAAEHIVEEVRRQFRQIAGLRAGKAKADYAKCVEIATSASLRMMAVPAIIAVLAPIVMGLWSLEALGGMLVGTIVTGFLLAVFMANAGGAWDNAKKYIEEGHFGGKGSLAHKAAVVGDTVGDPCKDTSGPSLNILIKLTSIVALIFVPLFI
ncbi:MAG: sodium-translocating pyrophosphatase [Candidatus Woesearchaeota archaeon]